jgi:hypothetical protein
MQIQYAFALLPLISYEERRKALTLFFYTIILSAKATLRLTAQHDCTTFAD